MEKTIGLWDQIGKPKYALAPMVDYSDLPFRMLCRKYGTTLTFTQMYHSANFVTQETYRSQCLLDINPRLDSPCFVQFCGHDPELLLQAGKYIAKLAPCMDLNLGCPQGIARRGHYGSYLLDHTDEVFKIVGYLTNNLPLPLSCKIRLFPDLDKTYQLALKLEELGVEVLTVHGRTKEEKKDKIKEANWVAISQIKQLLHIPIIANGGLETFEDIDCCLNETGVDCVMSGEKLIEMPFYFSRAMMDIDKIAFDYIDYCKELNQNISIIRGHLFKFYYGACKTERMFIEKINQCKTIVDCYIVAQEMFDYRKDTPLEKKFGWYRRYRNDNKDSSSFNSNPQKQSEPIDDIKTNEDNNDLSSFFT